MPKPGRLAALLLDWFAANARDLPWRHTRDPYAIWISEVMLQQTQVRTVVPYWNRWMQTLPDLNALAAAPLEQILKLWEGLGYYHRARNLHRAAQLIVEHHDGVFPTQTELVKDLPGIGPYTAGAICSLAFNHATPVLDGNVIRVLTRLHGIRQRVDRAPTRRRLEKLAAALVSAAAERRQPSAGRRRADWRADRIRHRPCGALNEALMELGAVICTPRRPVCPACPLAGDCVAHRAGIAERLPLKPRRAPTLMRRVLVFVGRRGRRWLVRQRPTHGVNAGLWEFPNLEATIHASALEAAQALFGRAVRTTIPLLTLRHTITRHRITLEVHQFTLNSARVARDATHPARSPQSPDTQRDPEPAPTVAWRWLTAPQLEHSLSRPPTARSFATWLAGRRNGRTPAASGQETGEDPDPSPRSPGFQGGAPRADLRLSDTLLAESPEVGTLSA